MRVRAVCTQVHGLTADLEAATNDKQTYLEEISMLAVSILLVLVFFMSPAPDV